MNHSIEIVGHRGDFYNKIENTYESIESAFQYVNACEVDVQLTLDKKLVLFHDECFLDTPITQLTSKKLKTHSLARNSITFLEELVPIIKNRKLFLELKTFNDNLTYKEDLAQEVCNWIKKNNLLENIVVISFNKECLEIIKKINKKIKTGINIRNIVNIKNEKFDYLLPPMLEVDEAVVNLCKKNNLKLYPWVSKENKNEELIQIKNMIDLKVDGIITNQIQEAKNILCYY